MCIEDLQTDKGMKMRSRKKYKVKEHPYNGRWAKKNHFHITEVLED